MKNSKRDIVYVWLIAFLIVAIIVLLGARAIATSNVGVDAAIELGSGITKIDKSIYDEAAAGDGADAADVTGGAVEELGEGSSTGAGSGDGADASSVGGAAAVLTNDVEEYYKTDLEAEIFRIEYTGEGAAITVASDNGERVIAPGTENTYVFNVENSSGMTLDYSLNMSSLASVGALSVDLPIEVKLSDYTGRYIVGAEDAWGSLAELAAANDVGSVGASRYIQYTLEWRWPFEGNDAADTLLGLVASGAKLDAQTLASAGLLGGEGGAGAEGVQGAGSAAGLASSGDGDLAADAEDGDVVGAASAGSTDGTDESAAQTGTGVSASEQTKSAIAQASAYADELSEVGEGPVTFSIKFDTVAQKDTTGAVGVGLVQTGDKLFINVAIAVCAVAALIVLVLLIVCKVRDRREVAAEAGVGVSDAPSAVISGASVRAAGKTVQAGEAVQVMTDKEDSRGVDHA